jgi:hypothetical protein
MTEECILDLATLYDLAGIAFRLFLLALFFRVANFGGRIYFSAFRIEEWLAI